MTNGVLTEVQDEATCVALLSMPLEVAIPLNAPVFCMKLGKRRSRDFGVGCRIMVFERLERAVRALSSETIRPVYLLLSGLDSVYLDSIPLDIVFSLQGQIIRVLAKIDSGKFAWDQGMRSGPQYAHGRSLQARSIDAICRPTIRGRMRRGAATITTRCRRSSWLKVRNAAR